MKPWIGRVGVLLGGLAVAGATNVATMGAASADDDGGCGGPGFAHVCVSEDGGAINYTGYTNYATGNCTIHMMLWDYTEKPGGVKVFTSDFPCANGSHDYRPHGLSNPASGHDYKAEMRVDWGERVDTYLSPDLFA